MFHNERRVEGWVKNSNAAAAWWWWPPFQFWYTTIQYLLQGKQQYLALIYFHCIIYFQNAIQHPINMAKNDRVWGGFDVSKLSNFDQFWLKYSISHLVFQKLIQFYEIEEVLELAHTKEEEEPVNHMHYVRFSQFYWHFWANLEMQICSMLQNIAIWSQGLI